MFLDPLGGKLMAADSVATPARNQSETELAFKRLTDEVLRARNIAEVLAKKLAPVLSPEIPVDGQSRPERPSLRSPLAQEIDAQAQSIDLLSWHLNSLIDRLEL